MVAEDVLTDPTPKKKRPPRKAKAPPESKTLPSSFAIDYSRIHRPPARPLGLHGWTVADIQAARAAQMRGQFKQSSRLLRSAKTEPSIYSPLLNRIAPHRGLPRDIVSRCKLEGASEIIRQEAVSTFAADGVSLTPGVLADIFEGLAMQGIKVCQNVWTVREDGARVDVTLTSYPTEYLEWSETDRTLYAWTAAGRVPVVHGDGTWVVFQLHDEEPWSWGALVALANLWIDLAYGRRDRANAAESAGDAKYIGTLPDGFATNSAEGRALLAEMEMLYEIRRVMLKPFGAEVERLDATAQNWQIFKELLESDDKAAQKVLLGQDGTMTNSGGSYVKAWGLFGVRNDIVESDLSAVGRGVSTGVLRPWSIQNFDRWDHLEYRWMMPDADEDARRESLATRRKSLYEDIASARANGMLVNQAYVDAVAKAYGIDPPQLAPTPVAPSESNAPAPASGGSASA